MSARFGSIPVVLLLALAGCESGIHKAGPPPPPTEVTPGSTFTVVKDFLIPSGDSSVFFQEARMYPQGDIQPDDSYCEFSAGAPTASGVVIKTGVFTVTDVTYDEASVGGGDMSVTSYKLREAVSGTTYRMDCMLPLLSAGALFANPVEIKAAVAGYMELKLAP